jgi:hypothetical protein
MSLPGFTAQLSLPKSAGSYKSAYHADPVDARTLVVPQAAQRGPGGIHGIISYCGDNVCLLYHCDDTGCHPLGFSEF